MKIGIVGGTGDLGKGLAVRSALAGHKVVIGSRKQEKAEKAAEDCLERVNGDIEGVGNSDAVKNVDTVVLGLPYKYATETVDEIKDSIHEDATVITPVVSMTRDEDGFKYVPPEEGSAAEEIRNTLPESNSLAGAFHNVAAKKLYHPNVDLDLDIAVFGEEEAKKHALELVESIEGLRGLDAGGLSVASQVEAVTPLLINLAVNNEMRDLGVKFV